MPGADPLQATLVDKKGDQSNKYGKPMMGATFMAHMKVGAKKDADVAENICDRMYVLGRSKQLKEATLEFGEYATHISKELFLNYNTFTTRCP